MNYKQRLLTNIIILVLFAAVCSATYTNYVFAGLDQTQGSFVFYVSPKVTTDPDGTFERPFNSLLEAQKIIRKKKKTLFNDRFTVILKKGEYYINEPIVFDENDSGMQDSIIEYKAEEDGLAIISGFTEIPFDKIEQVNDEIILDDLKIENQVKIYKVRLSKTITQRIKLPPGNDLGSINKMLMPEILINDSIISIAHWPNHGWSTANAEQTTNSVGNKVLRLYFKEKLPVINRGIEYLFGFPIKDWAYAYRKLTLINRKENYLEITMPVGEDRIHLIESRWQMQNTFSGLKYAGRYVLDEKNATLYFSLKENHKLESIKLSVRNKPFMVFNKASNLIISGLHFKGTASNGIIVKNSSEIKLHKLDISSVGKTAISIHGGVDNRVTSTNIANVGSAGIYVGGGDRKKLIRSNHRIHKNTISNYGRWNVSYSPGVKVYGVGVTVDSNSIFDGPHSGVIFSGNDHSIEKNEIFNVALSTGDVGAIYAGRDWTMRGNRIVNNYIHDIRNNLKTGTVGIYLDDLFSGTEIYKNIIENTDKCILLGGGRDNIINGNLFIDCDIPVWADARGIFEKKKKVLSAKNGSTWDLYGKALEKINNKTYSTRYPAFSKLFESNPLQPLGNVISYNKYQCGNEIVTSNKKQFKKWYSIKTNECIDASNIYNYKKEMLRDVSAKIIDNQ